MILHRYLISKGSSSIFIFSSALRLCRAAAKNFEREMRMASLWDDVKDHVVGYEWGFDEITNQSMCFALLSEGFAAVICELHYPRNLFSKPPIFDNTIESDTLLVTNPA
jgi:hypothetical protein